MFKARTAYASLPATPLIPLPFTSNGHWKHGFDPTTVRLLPHQRLASTRIRPRQSLSSLRLDLVPSSRPRAIYTAYRTKLLPAGGKMSPEVDASVTIN